MNETNYTNLDLSNILGVQPANVNKNRDASRQMEINEWFLRLFDRRSNDLFERRITVEELIAMAAQIVDGLNKA